MPNIRLNYITEPLEQYVTRHKADGMKYTSTTYHCPLCQAPFSKRSFEEHVTKEHAARMNECFARLFGVPWPAKCKCCNKDLKYSFTYKGFQRVCSDCAAGRASETQAPQYNNADEANKHVAQLEVMLAEAKQEAKRLAKEAELDRIPIQDLPLPSKKDPRFLQRISKMMRIYAVNGEKDRIIELANIIDGKLKNNS